MSEARPSGRSGAGSSGRGGVQEGLFPAAAPFGRAPGTGGGTGVFRILLTGSREAGAHDQPWVWDQLDAWAQVWGDASTMVLMEGQARGVDALGRSWARFRGVATIPFPADWKRYGKAAGSLRNGQMVAAGAHLCLAFPGAASVGTWDCVERAKAAGMAVVVRRLLVREWE